MPSVVLNAPSPLRVTLKHNGFRTEILIWPARLTPKVVLFLIPGNPGWAELYFKFLGLVHQGNQDHLEIITFTYYGLKSFVTNDGDNYIPKVHTNLPEQLAHAISVFDEIHGYTTNHDGTKPKFLVIGHSIGGYMSQELYRARSEMINGVILLCPALENLSKTPKGRELVAVRNVVAITVLSILFEIVGRVLPTSSTVWALRQIHPIEEGLARVAAIGMIKWAVKNVLSMFMSSCKVVKDLDEEFYKENGEKFIILYVEGDGWATTEHYENMRRVNSNGKVYMQKGIRHDFVLAHSDSMAAVVKPWVEEILKKA